jgi:23S rRNA (uracil1939-C5)-methyltransferase
MSTPEDHWLVDKMVPGGDGMARLADGRIGFATGAFAGDRIRVEEQTSHKSWVRADAWSVSSRSPDRVEPPCPVADRCGGCEWMGLGRTAQVRHKASLVKQALERTGKLRDLPEPLVVVQAGPDLGYRNRLRLHVDADGRIGLFARGSHELVPIPGCPVSEPAIDRTLAELRALGAGEPSVFARWREIELRVAPLGPPVSVWLLPRDERPATERELALLRALAERFQVVEAGGTGEDQRWPLPEGVELRVPPGGFVQVNWEVNVALVEAVVAGARQRRIRRFIELYAGAGNFTLPLLRAGLEGIAVEHAGASIRAARRAARAADLSDDAFVAADGPRELERRRSFAPDLVLLDPPRTGAREAVPALLELRPPWVAFCACDPVTLARDVRALSEAYALDSVTAFDMFPHTHHVETLLWLHARAS